MVELVNKEEFTATVAALGLWDNKAETVSPDRDTKYARVRRPVGHCTQTVDHVTDAANVCWFFEVVIY